MVYSEYDEKGEYRVVECDRCGATDKTLYDDEPEQLCMECYLKKYREDFVETYWDALVEEWGKDYLEGVERVEDDY